MENKTILEGRIYPSIRNSVNNRYLLLLGFFVVYGSLYIYHDFQKAIYSNPYLRIGLIAFWTLLAVHNYLNYYFNAKEQVTLEGKSYISWYRHSRLEFWFGVGFITFNILAWAFLPDLKGGINMLGSFAEWIQVLSLLALVIYVVYTAQIAAANKKLLESEIGPNIIAYFEVENDVVNFVLSNIGKGVAKNVRLVLTPPLKGMDGILFDELTKDSHPIFPPNYALSFDIGRRQAYIDSKATEYKIQLSFESLAGLKYSLNYNIDFKYSYFKRIPNVNVTLVNGK